MKFGKKSYVISVIAFVLCLNLGFLSLAYFSYRHCVKSYQEVAKLRYEYIVAEFENTYEYMINTGNEDHADILMNNFMNRFTSAGIYLAFAENGEIICSSFVEGIKLRGDSSVSTVTVDGTRYTMINSKICDKYQMFFAINAQEIDEEFNSLLITYTLSCAVICLFATLLLYYTMSKSSALVERTLSAMDKISGGDMTANEGLDAKGDLAVLANGFDNMCGAINARIDATNKNAEEKQLIVDMLASQFSAPLVQISRATDEIIEQNADREELVKSTKQIRKQTKRLQNISEKLLDIASAREKALRITSVDVPSLLTDTAFSLSKYARSIGISIETSLVPMSVNADEELLSLLLYNLAENAIKACHSGCTVMLSCGDGMIVVRDNGSGMSEKQLEMITKPFYKADNDGYRGYGAGLGLTLCKQIIDVHGADIRFESEQGYGTTVTVDFNSEK